MATTSRRRRAAAPADDAPLMAALDAAPILASAPEASIEPEAPAAKPARKRAPAKPRKTAAVKAEVAEPPSPEPEALAEAEPATPRAPARKSAKRRPAAAEAEAVATLAPADAEVETPAAAPVPASVEPEATEPPARKSGRSRRRSPAASASEATVAEAAVPAVSERPEPAPADAPVAPPAPTETPLPALEAAEAQSPAPEARPEAEVGAEVGAEPVVEAPPAPAPAPQPPTPSRLTLAARRLQWEAGHGCPETLRQAVSRWQDRDGRLSLNETEALDELVAVAARCGHRLTVDEAVWQQLALKGDLRQRIVHLEASFPQGLEAAEFEGAAAGPLPARLAQSEAAFFAACAGACLLADAEGLEPERELALAWQLVQRHFGARQVAVRLRGEADEALRARWQALLAPLSADASVQLLHPGEPLPAGLDVLIVDQRPGWLALPAEEDTAAPWLWVLSPEDGLQSHPAEAEAWLGRLDRLGTGAVAQGLAAATPEALGPLLLQRGWAEVADQWPAWAPEERAVAWPDETRQRHAQALAATTPLLARWQRSGFLSDSDQLALRAQLAQAEAAEREAALVALPELLAEALGRGLSRVVLFAESDAAEEMPAWAELLNEWLAAAGWQAQVLPTANREADAVLRRFRDAEGPSLLLVADGLPGSEPRIPTAPRLPLIVHLDRPWDEAQRERRLQRLRLPRAQRAVPVWQLLPEGSLAARRQHLPAPEAAGATVTGRLRRGPALQAWLAGLAACLLPAQPEAVPAA
ncbi:hypothetical protein [Ideonella oryzae]|uniref:Uncharacterized protein n=1 Tax=Ideonella oryzae TaxID=2937441 RepID=A0ABT1BQN2_9BURK|nr:hypothetical protein [Ideonella oryzae]MCO5978546.1 hypothetical protein [Ideonella oryzae]